MRVLRSRESRLRAERREQLRERAARINAHRGRGDSGRQGSENEQLRAAERAYRASCSGSTARRASPPWASCSENEQLWAAVQRGIRSTSSRPTEGAKTLPPGSTTNDNLPTGSSAHDENLPSGNATINENLGKPYYTAIRTRRRDAHRGRRDEGSATAERSTDCAPELRSSEDTFDEVPLAPLLKWLMSHPAAWAMGRMAAAVISSTTSSESACRAATSCSTDSAPRASCRAATAPTEGTTSSESELQSSKELQGNDNTHRGC